MTIVRVAADGVLGFIITFGTSLGALLAQQGVATLADISQGAYAAAFVGALVATAKLVQSRLAEPPADPGALK